MVTRRDIPEGVISIDAYLSTVMHVVEAYQPTPDSHSWRCSCGQTGAESRSEGAARSAGIGHSRRGPDGCAVDGCLNPRTPERSRYCTAHKSRVLHHGTTLEHVPIGATNDLAAHLSDGPRPRRTPANRGARVLRRFDLNDTDEL